MNINLKLKLPLVSKDDPTDKKVILLSTQLLLNPLYALEEDVITPFTTLTEEQLPWVRQVLFNNSITVYRLTNIIEKISILKPEELFSLRRDLVICLTSYELAKQLHKDLNNSISRSKSLGDFSVSTSTKADGMALSRILSDASSCIDEMKALISEIERGSIRPATFVKGQYNPSSRTSNRLWWHSELPITIKDGYASKKYHYNGNSYKAASFNLAEYSSNSHYSALEYYRLVADNGNGAVGSEHEHKNLDILNKIGEDSEGNLLFNGNYPSPGSENTGW